MSSTSIGEIHRVQLEPVKVNQPRKKHGWLYYVLIGVAVYYLLLFIGFIIYSQGFKCNSKHLNGYCSGWSNSCLRGKCAKRCKADSDCKDDRESNGRCVDKHCAPASAQPCTTITDCKGGEICSTEYCTHGTNRGPYLVENQTLKLGEYLQSANGLYTAAPDSKGRFHIVGGSDAGSDNTTTPKVDFYWPNVEERPTSSNWLVTLQTDGNFVLDSGQNRMTTRDVSFATIPPGSPGHFVAKLNDNGKFNVYVGTPTKLGDIVPAARPFN